MDNRDVVILCRNRKPTDQGRPSLKELLALGSHVKNTYFVRNVPSSAAARKIKAKIQDNVAKPEWIGRHRFSFYDLLNYVNNGNRYVYHPDKSRDFFDPFGIPTITSLHIYDALDQKGYHPLNIENLEPNKSELRRILRRNPLAVVISATFLGTAQEIQDIVRFVRKTNENVPIIIGSAALLSKVGTDGRLSKDYEQIITNRVFMILEEYGLDTLDSLLQTIEAQGDVSLLPNIVYRDTNGQVFYTESRRIPVDLNRTIPDWSRLAPIAMDAAFVRASQGCAFRCKFCTFPKAAVKLQYRSIDSIREELRRISDAGIRNLAFTDDHFAVNPTRIEEVSRMMIREGFNFNWFAGIRSSVITEDNAPLLRDSGCKVLCMGLESGDDRVLKLMDKRTTTSQNMKCLEVLDKNGILAYGSFIVGFPGETHESIANTIAWINNSPLKFYKVWLFYLLPGSIAFDQQEQYGITYFGGAYDYCLWKTPTLDALTASEKLRDFILSIESAALMCDNSPMYAFFPLFSAGYSAEDILKFHQIHTDIIKNELSDGNWVSKWRFRKEKMQELKRLQRFLLDEARNHECSANVSTVQPIG